LAFFLKIVFNVKLKKGNMKIGKLEFEKRIDRIRADLVKHDLSGLIVYGDEYRKENLRYVSNFWPIFERGICFIGLEGNPIVAGAPEGELYAKEMCVWDDLRNIKELACVSVPEEIQYPNAVFSNFNEILNEILRGGTHLGVVGTFDLPGPIRERLVASRVDLELVAADSILADARMRKSEAEIECLRHAGEIACTGYKELMATAVPGNSELFAAGKAEGAARSAGAEAITFHVFGSGDRTNTVIGRPTEKVIVDGDMIMSSLAVQYEGYVSTVEFPFVAGHPSSDQRKILNVLFEAANVQRDYLRPDMPAAQMVRAVQEVFAKHDMQKFDLYPPMHGIGLAEAESPYPNEDVTYSFEAGMCLNSDISLFGHTGGSNRIEEGFLITDNGSDSLTPLIRHLCEEYISEGRG
jgi:Xaa-Pro aminopeptidase